MHRILVLIGVLIFSLNVELVSQVKKGLGSKMLSKRAQDPHELLESLRGMSGVESISEIEKLIVIGTKTGDNVLLANCYDLLGDILTSVEQGSLAIHRYEDAIDYYKLAGDDNEMGVIYHKIGRIWLRNTQAVEASANFQFCLDLKVESSTKLLCQEGLADGLRVTLKKDQGVSLYQELIKVYTTENDSSSLVRIHAKLAKAFAQQQDRISRANSSYEQSQTYTNYNTSPSDYKELGESKEVIIQTQPNEEINLRNTQNDINFQLNKPDLVISENIKIADAYIQKEKYNEAQQVIDKSKDFIAANGVSPSQQSALLRQSADLTQKQGQFEEALADLRASDEQQKIANDLKQKEVENLLAILEGQRQVDLTRKDLTIWQKESALLENRVQNQRVLIGLLSLLLLGSLLAIYKIWKSNEAKRAANQLLQLKSLRAQMNPHFIFNVLNSVNQFISLNDERSANKYLSEVSKLMRMVLQDSQKDLIPLEDELEMIGLYLKLEHGRFRDRFEYNIQIDENLDRGRFQIPPMLIQPFLENAIWHGMRYREEKGMLDMSVKEVGQEVHIEIADNGIGRKNSAALKTKAQKEHKPVGLRNVTKRLELINKIYKQDYSISVEDHSDDLANPGTRVLVKIPKAA